LTFRWVWLFWYFPLIFLHIRICLKHLFRSFPLIDLKSKYIKNITNDKCYNLLLQKRFF
jgi:hypothetical protein